MRMRNFLVLLTAALHALAAVPYPANAAGIQPE